MGWRLLLGVLLLLGRTGRLHRSAIAFIASLRYAGCREWRCNMKSAAVALLVMGAICVVGVQVLPWGADVPVHRGSVESFDIGVSPTGNLYAAVVGAADQFGGQRRVYVYRSANQGHSWNLVIDFPTTSLTNVRLVVGEYEDLDLVHLFFADDSTHKILVRNLGVKSDGRPHGFADHTFGSSRPGRCFEVARSYGPLGGLPPRESDAYYIVAAQYVPVLNEIHVFRSEDYGGSWESVLRIENLAFGHVIEPEMALTWGAGQFFLVYPKDLEDTDHWYDYSVFGTTGIGETGWADEWMVNDQSLPNPTPSSYMYPQICAAFGSAGAQGTAWVVLNTRDFVSDTFTLEMWYWKLPPWRPATPSREYPWARQPIVGPTSEGLLYSCLDVSSVTSPDDRDVYMLFGWEGSMRLYHAFPDTPVALAIEGSGMNDHRYFLAHDPQLRPRVVHAPALPGAASCVGIAYTSSPVVVPTDRSEGVDLYYDSSCTVRITPHTTDPTEEWVGEITAPSEEQAQRGFTALASSICGVTHSHAIEVTWSFVEQGFSQVVITIDGPDGVLAVHESDETSSSAVLHVSLPAGGAVTVTVTASNAAHSSVYSASKSITLDPC
jgi:hypothetical protein